MRVIGNLRCKAPDGVGESHSTPPTLCPMSGGLVADLRWQIGDRFSLIGEVYAGRALGADNAGILPGINAPTLVRIRESGGPPSIMKAGDSARGSAGDSEGRPTSTDSDRPQQNQSCVRCQNFQRNCVATIKASLSRNAFGRNRV